MKETEEADVRMNDAKHHFIESLTKQDIEFIQRWEVNTGKQATLDKMVTLLVDRDYNEKNALKYVKPYQKPKEGQRGGNPATNGASKLYKTLGNVEVMKSILQLGSMLNNVWGMIILIRNVTKRAMWKNNVENHIANQHSM